MLSFRKTQSAVQAMDSHGNLYFGLMEPIAIGCWNSSTEYDRSNIKIVENNRETLQFVSGMKVIKNAFEQESLWICTNRLPVSWKFEFQCLSNYNDCFSIFSFQKFRAGKFDWNDYNFRIQAIPISEVMKTGGCNLKPKKIESQPNTPK